MTTIKIEEWMAPSEAAELLGVSRQRVMHLVALGRIRTMLPWGRYSRIVSRADVEAIVATRAAS